MVGVRVGFRRRALLALRGTWGGTWRSLLQRLSLVALAEWSSRNGLDSGVYIRGILRAVVLAGTSCSNLLRSSSRTTRERTVVIFLLLGR